MKNIYVKDLKEYVGSEISETFLMNDIVENENRYKNQWQDVIISDKTGEASIKIWAENTSKEYITFVGKIVRVFGRVDLFQDRASIQVISMEVVEGFDWSDYVFMLDKPLVSKLKNSLKEDIMYVKSIDEKLGTLLEVIATDTRVEKMARMPAGDEYYKYCGALLAHTVDVCERTKSIIENYESAAEFKPYSTNINKPLAVTGALLHDIGKLNSYTEFPIVKRSQRSWLVDSTTDSVLFTTSYNNALPSEKRVTDLSHLNHIILTASAEKDRGKQPRTLEAIIVNEANTSSKKEDIYDTTFYENDRLNFVESNHVYSKKNRLTLVRQGKDV